MLKSYHGFTDSVKKGLNKFAEKYRFDKLENAMVFNYRGENIYYVKGKYSEEEGDYCDIDYRECMILSMKYGELHLTHNHNDFYNGKPRPKGIPPFFSEDDIENLLVNYSVNNQKRYIFKSITAESTNGSRMLLIKNKNFTTTDEIKLIDASKKLSEFHKSYIMSIYNSPKTKRKEIIKNFKVEFNEIQKIFEEANCKINVEGI